MKSKSKIRVHFIVILLGLAIGFGFQSEQAKKLLYVNLPKDASLSWGFLVRLNQIHSDLLNAHTIPRARKSFFKRIRNNFKESQEEVRASGDSTFLINWNLYRGRVVLIMERLADGRKIKQGDWLDLTKKKAKVHLNWKTALLNADGKSVWEKADLFLKSNLAWVFSTLGFILAIMGFFSFIVDFLGISSLSSRMKIKRMLTQDNKESRDQMLSMVSELIDQVKTLEKITENFSSKTHHQGDTGQYLLEQIRRESRFQSSSNWKQELESLQMKIVNVAAKASQFKMEDKAALIQLSEELRSDFELFASPEDRVTLDTSMKHAESLVETSSELAQAARGAYSKVHSMVQRLEKIQQDLMQNPGKIEVITEKKNRVAA